MSGEKITLEAPTARLALTPGVWGGVFSPDNKVSIRRTPFIRAGDIEALTHADQALAEMVFHCFILPFQCFQMREKNKLYVS